MPKAIILFDGECNFCSSSVQFILNRDDKEYFSFASLQSDIGKELLKSHSVGKEVDSIVLIENDKAYIESTAALRICLHLKGSWKLCYGFLIIPSFLRNVFYKLIAKHRYRLFGKADQCMIPPPHIRNRFLS